MNRPLLRMFFWEYLQNLMPALGFFYAFPAWRTGAWAAAALYAAAGSLAGALIIRFTEPFIEPGPREPVRNTLVNAVFFGAGALLLVMYFDSPAGNGWVDAGLGALAGGLLSISQAKAAGQDLSGRHLAAMAISLGLALPGARLLLYSFEPLPAAAGFCLLMTVIILRVEYWPGRPDRYGSN